MLYEPGFRSWKWAGALDASPTRKQYRPEPLVALGFGS